jgi:ABC-type multidrug transport system fused ATPase/permease subunit
MLRRLVARLFPSPDGTSADLIAHAPPIAIRDIIRRFWPYTKGRRRWLIAAVLLSVAGPGVEAVQIWLFKIVIDDVLIAREFSRFPGLVVLYVLLTIASGLVMVSASLLSTWLSQRFLVDLRKDVFRHLHTLSLDFFDTRRLGDLISRLTGDISSIEDFLVSGMQDAFSYGVRIAVFVTALFLLQWDMALVALLVTPMFWFAASRFSRRMKAASRERRRRAGSISAVAEESFGNAALVQAYNRQGWEIARFDRENEAKYRAEMAAARLRALFSPIVDALEVLGGLAVITFGIWVISRDQLTVGGLLVFLTYLERLYGPIRSLSRLATSAYSASAGADRVIELLDEKPSTVSRPGAPGLLKTPGRVRFDSVTFTYPGAGVPALEDVSLAVRRGEVLALVGPSGAGKSTVAKLFLRFYDPQLGRIMVDDHDLRDLDLFSLRENTALVLQETLVFDGTVRGNIAYGRPSASVKEIEAAARAADAHDFICDLPQGYDTLVGQRGRRLSGGQRQRVAIARAILRDAPLLILDEPTTGLDTESGWRILEPLRRLMERRATIVISHNMLTVRDATEIAVLEHGRVVERGVHDDLLRLNARYADLHRLAGFESLGGHVNGSERAASQQVDGSKWNGFSPAPEAIR